MSFIQRLGNIVGHKHCISNASLMTAYTHGWRFGSGPAKAVVKPGTLLETWRVLELCVAEDVIVLMQAANTGVTGGSTPNGSDYDRPIVIINTMRIKETFLINNGEQVVALGGSTLYELEEKLDPYHRSPHSVIGSSCVGASIIGGICNNSGGALVQRGPAYTELALYARIDSEQNLILVNELGIELGDDPEQILTKLQSGDFKDSDIQQAVGRASDDEYEQRIRDIDAVSPSRFNSDERRLFGASGCAGRVAVFAVRVDTFKKPQREQIFYVGANDPKVFTKIRRDILGSFKQLPVSGEYLHRDCYKLAKKYGKDSFLVIDKLGTRFLPRLFALKRFADRITGGLPFFPAKFSDRMLQLFGSLWPNHLPERMEAFHRTYDHHWIIEMADEGIEEAGQYFQQLFASHEGAYFACSPREAKAAVLHRYVAAGALARYHIIHRDRVGALMTMDIAFPRNERDWFEKLPPDIDDLFDVKLYYGHLFCHVMHQNYVVKRGVDQKQLKQKLLAQLDARQAEYPAEHNVGHEYVAKPRLRAHYRKLDPTNSYNPGIGHTSKNKHWGETPQA